MGCWWCIGKILSLCLYYKFNIFIFGQNYSFPKEAGYRFEARTRYLLIEIHYDNPKFLNDIVDDSGVKLYFTEKLREIDLGLFQLGSDGSPLSLQIPPRSNLFSFTSICYPECTNVS